MLIAATDTALTLGGFIALATLGMGAIGLAASASSRTARLRERLTQLETQLADHLKNGTRHERKDQG